MRLDLTAVVAAVLASTLPPAAALAQDAGGSPSHRELGGHRFQVSHLIEAPFSVTSFGMHTALGSGQARGPSLDLSTSPPTILPATKWYDFVEYAEQIDFTVRILEYLSIRAGFLGGVRQGTGDGSALVVGTNFQVNATGAVKGSLPLGEKLRLSLSGDATYGPRGNLLILAGLIEAVRAGTFERADLFKDRNALTAGTTAAAAFAPWPFLGLVANLRYIHTKSVDIEESDQDGWAAAGGVEFDALPLVPWLPLGANLVYRKTDSLGSDGLASQDDYGLGFYYTGRPDLALGLELVRREGRLETELRSEESMAWINFRYFW